MRCAIERLAVRDVGWVESGETPIQPTLELLCKDQSTRLRNRLQESGGSLLSPTDIDVTCRLQIESDESGLRGILGVSNNVTGEFIAEVEIDMPEISTFLEAAKQFTGSLDDGGSYLLKMCDHDEVIATYEKQTFLTFGPDGTLIRRQSLIPNHIEL